MPQFLHVFEEKYSFCYMLLIDHISIFQNLLGFTSCKKILLDRRYDKPLSIHSRFVRMTI